jgi:hypothetical protein
MNEQNAVQLISEYLIERKIPYVLHDNDVFEILIGTYKNPDIQLEYCFELNLDSVYISFHFFEHDSSDDYIDINDIEEPLNQIITKAKEYNKAYGMIERHLMSIEEICDEYDLEVDIDEIRKKIMYNG